MKIAIFTDTYTPDVNGVAKTLARFTTFLKNKAIEFRVFVPKSSQENQVQDQIHAYPSLPFLLYPECRLAFPNLAEIKAELNEFNPDIIHVATPFSMGLAGLHFSKKLNIPIVGSYHTDFDKYLEHYNLQVFTFVLWKYLKWFHQSLEKIFVPSQDTKARLKKYQFKNLAIWPRGVDRSIFHPNHRTDQVRQKYQINEKYILLYVGRLAPEKDVMILPEIAAQLPAHLKDNVHWLIVGDGPLKANLAKVAPSNMTFTGFLAAEQLVQAYATADLFVFPSASETFGNVVLESLACGVPVIGANVGGVRTIIQHNQTGILCQEKNSHQFVSAIVRMLSDPQLRVTMAEAGIKYAQSQSWEQIFQRLLQDYRMVLTKNDYETKLA